MTSGNSGQSAGLRYSRQSKVNNARPRRIEQCSFARGAMCGKVMTTEYVGRRRMKKQMEAAMEKLNQSFQPKPSARVFLDRNFRPTFHLARQGHKSKCRRPNTHLSYS